MQVSVYRDVTEKSLFSFFFNHKTWQIKIKVLLANFSVFVHVNIYKQFLENDIDMILFFL